MTSYREVLVALDDEAAVAARRWIIRSDTPACEALAEPSSFLHESAPAPPY